MNNFQLKTVHRALLRNHNKQIKLDNAELGFLADCLVEHKMTEGKSRLTPRQNTWLNKIGSKER